MPSTFEGAILKVLQHEGGYVNDKNDAGGETNFGISKAQYPNIDIKNLTVDGAKAIYKRDYWDPQYEQIMFQSVADKILDMSVILGKENAVKLVQAAAGTTQDGQFGPATLMAVNSMNVARLLQELRALQCTYFARTAVLHPGQSLYLLGWMRRGVE